MSEERVWTPGQQAAIDTRRGDLIISAAAGSGKTAVLCERVIRSLLDENDPINISDMLIVTFTEASARELKERIANAIRAQMAKTPENRRLVRQLMMLQSADIGTIHSFCNSLISRNTSKLSLPSGIRVSDAFESDIIALKIMERVIDGAYTIDADFPAMVENFTMASDANLSKTLLDIYKKTQSHPKGIELLRGFALEYSKMDKSSWNNGRYAKQLCASVKSESEFYIRTLENAVEYIKNDEKVYAAWGESYEYDIAYLSHILQGASCGWEALTDALKGQYEPPNCKAVRGITDSKIDEIKATRNKIKEKIKKIREEYYSDFFSILKGCERNAKFLSTLYRVLAKFEKSFAEEKIRLSVMDFTDLERMTYRLLVDTDGSPTALALETAKKYRQIYIDEYQDTNAIQDGIFKAISRANRFLVGDIKQSIYGFRGAEPSIFAEYRDAFYDYDEKTKNTNDDPHRIFLSNNFRCDRPIIDFSNGIFATLFRNNSGKIAYLDEDALVFSKAPKENYEKVSIILAERDGDCAYYAEAAAVAHEIKKLLENGASPSDVAVIMRSTKDIVKVFKSVFKKEGIPVDGSASGSVFDSPEVLLLLALLNCIDNPNRDIWFAGMLSSRVFGIEFNDIVDIASEKYETRLSLYDKFRAYTEQNDFEKGKKLLAWLSKARESANGKKVYELVDDLCNDFAIYALASLDKENAERAKKYIEAFKNFARNYEKNAFRGLHSFLRFVEDVRSGKAGEVSVSSESAEKKDAVKFITAHHSKGLEFEYCFISGCGKSMNDSDAKAKFLFSAPFGAVVRPIDLGGRVKYTSPMYRAILENMTENQVDEEMRILYVALTRARKKLYVTAETKDIEKMLSDSDKMRETCSPYVFRTFDSYILWVLSSYNKNSGDVELFGASATPYYDWKKGEGTVEMQKIGENEPEKSEIVCQPSEISEAEEKDTAKANTDLLTISELSERLEYVYPFVTEQTLPSKLAVSRLFPGVLDTDAVDMPKREEKFTDIPRFISSSGENEVTGAMRGTATHIFMQFCDFENAEKNGVELELARLCDKRFIDQSLAKLVYIDKLKKFFASDLYKEIKSAKEIWREKRFNIMLPASEFTDREELKNELSSAKLLVQGVFDCLVERSDGTLKLIDYKTDAVSGNIEQDEKMFRTRYATQLSYYTRACELMMGKKVAEASVYSLGLGREVRII